MEQNVEMCSLYHSFLGEVGTGEIHAREKQRRSLRCCRKLEQVAFILYQSCMFPLVRVIRPDPPSRLPASRDWLSLSPGTRIQSTNSISDASYVSGRNRGFLTPDAVAMREFHACVREIHALSWATTPIDRENASCRPVPLYLGHQGVNARLVCEPAGYPAGIGAALISQLTA